MAGGTTFHFVTDGVESALAQATEGAAGADVRLGGGAAAIRAYLRAGLLDEPHIAIAPTLLGGGERVFTDDVVAALAAYTITEHTPAPAATHVVLTRG
jgi:dihydrofolate reductase